MIAILLAPVYLLANFYLLRRVMDWVKAWFPFFRTVRHWALPVAVQAFLACSIVIAFFLPEGRLRRVMKLIGNYWLGVLLYVLLAVIAADLLRLLLGYVLPFKHIFVTTQMHRIAGCVCALVILIASIWGVVNARIIHVTPYDVTVDKTVEGMDEMKVVLVADLHLGYNIGEKQMQQMVDRINEQDADLVVIAGDIFDNEWEAVEAPETIAATLRSIRSKYGVYACYGNHDIEEPVLAGFTFRQSEKKESDPRMDEFLKNANITLLRDEGTLIDAIQASRAGYSGIVINPGAYAHYSYAIYDALRCAPVPAVEVHISDIAAREPFRAVSVTAPACVKTISGHGLEGYLEAMDYLLAHAPDAEKSAAPRCGCGGEALV